MIRRFLALALAWAAAAPVQAADDLWTLLKGGGQVLLIRHASTEPGVGDPQGMRLGDCSTQRNLSEEGRREAKALGEALRARGVPVARVYASPWCRCRETATLAFGGFEELGALGNLFGRPENRDRQMKALQPLLSRKPEKGNLVLVTHGTVVQPVSGIAPEQGEIVILTPRGSGKYDIAGRLKP